MKKMRCVKVKANTVIGTALLLSISWFEGQKRRTSMKLSFWSSVIPARGHITNKSRPALLLRKIKGIIRVFRLKSIDFFYYSIDAEECSNSNGMQQTSISCLSWKKLSTLMKLYLVTWIQLWIHQDYPSLFQNNHRRLRNFYRSAQNYNF